MANSFEQGSATLFPYNTKPHATGAPVSGSILEYNNNNPAFQTFYPVTISTVGASTITINGASDFSTGQVSVVRDPNPTAPAASTLYSIQYIPIASTVVTNVATTAANPNFSSVVGVPIAFGFTTPPGSAVPGSTNNSTIWGY